MARMFCCASSFNKYIGDWDINDKANTDRIFKNCPIINGYKPYII